MRESIELLDQNAAFDMVDHSILVDRLLARFGIDSVALNLVQSYVERRSQSVCILGVSSTLISLCYCVRFCLPSTTAHHDITILTIEVEDQLLMTPSK